MVEHKIVPAAEDLRQILVRHRIDGDAIRVHAARNRLISVTQVRDDAALPTLSCRIEITMKDGSKIVESLIDGGKELAIDSSTIDAWALDLWKEAGRSI